MSTRNWFLSIAISVVASGCSVRAGAQTSEVNAVYDASAVLETNIQGVRTFREPPAGFDALAASDQELATYGFPPRPDRQNAPAAFSMWSKAMAASRIRWNGELKHTGLYSQAIRRVHAPLAAEAAATTGQEHLGSSNWSGFINSNTLEKYNSNTSFYMVLSEFNVPRVSQAVNNCDGGWDMAASWNGIDGDLDSNALLQGGSVSGAFCSGSTKLQVYYAWVEWWPGEDMIEEFTVNPGDDMYVETWDTSPTQGYVFIVDMNLGVNATYSLTPNGGSGLIGNTAEYIVERPCCNGSNPKPLANYVWDFWANSYAYTFAGHAKGVTPYYPGSTALGTDLVYMTDDRGAHVISAPTAQGKYGIFFEAESCAVDPGCTP
jgi:hypothetical protein